ncbi:hypothetical protein RZN05_02435 [Sphingomonas sp. HF-S4]|uniref:Uncharacterized protein n=1 Tax=Sphingomonas agrestis TaxID=3080540 RepID=A0ABU3Y3S1_9SPHN|nr:hypothetical protein [Sphingomonas sp. HF-S4]MDV3455827.1 hypothetical protein [Sphingomonas sp. HF-S4]
MWDFVLKHEIGVGDIIQTAAFLAALVTVIIESNRYRRGQVEAAAQRREDAAQGLEARKIEIYQRLEIESNRVFEFEARHPELVPMMKRRLAPVAKLGDLVVRDEYSEEMNARQIAMIARKYYEMNCNLFEIAARLRKYRLIDDDVFGSWVAWYFDTCTEWGFRALWNDLRDNYTADLRAIFDPLCGRLLLAWDIPHASPDANDPFTTYGLPDVPPAELEARRSEFYVEIANLFDCPTIGGWMAKVAATGLPAEHPLAYS